MIYFSVVLLCLFHQITEKAANSSTSLLISEINFFAFLLLQSLGRRYTFTLLLSCQVICIHGCLSLWGNLLFWHLTWRLFLLVKFRTYTCFHFFCFWTVTLTANIIITVTITIVITAAATITVIITILFFFTWCVVFLVTLVLLLFFFLLFVSLFSYLILCGFVLHLTNHLHVSSLTCVTQFI